MNNSFKPRIIMPSSPNTYYGLCAVVSELCLKDKLFIGEFNRVEEMIVEEIRFDEKLNSYEVETDKAILLAAPLARIARSSL